MSTIDARMAKLIEESSDPYYLSEDVILDLADRLDPVLAEHGYTVHADSAEEYLQAIQEGLNGDDAELSEIIGTVLAGAGGAMLGGLPGAIAGVGAYHAAKHGLKYLAKPGPGKRDWDQRSLLNKAAHTVFNTKARRDHIADRDLADKQRRAHAAAADTEIAWNQSQQARINRSPTADATHDAPRIADPEARTAPPKEPEARTAPPKEPEARTAPPKAPEARTAPPKAPAARTTPPKPVTPADARRVSIQNRNKFLGSAPASKPGVRKVAGAPAPASKPGVRKKVGPPAPTQAVSTDKAPSKPKVRKPKQPTTTSGPVLSAGKSAGGI